MQKIGNDRHVQENVLTIIGTRNGRIVGNRVQRLASTRGVCANNRVGQKTRWPCVYTHDCARANSRPANPSSELFRSFQKRLVMELLIVRLYRNNCTAIILGVPP